MFFVKRSHGRGIDNLTKMCLSHFICKQLQAIQRGGLEGFHCYILFCKIICTCDYQSVFVRLRLRRQQADTRNGNQKLQNGLEEESPAAEVIHMDVSTGDTRYVVEPGKIRNVTTVNTQPIKVHPSQMEG